MRRALVLPALAALLLLALPPARGDEDRQVGRAERRKQLVAEAGAADTQRDGSAALEAMRRSLAADRAFAASIRPADEAQAGRLRAFEATLAERALLLGEPGTDAQAGGGALGAAERLRRWLVGRLPCRVLLTNPPPAPPEERAYDFPPPEPAASEDPVEPPAKAPGNGDAGSKEPAAPNGDAPPAAPKDTPKAPKAAPPAPKTPQELAAVWARGVRDAEGAAFVQRVIRPSACADVDVLLRAAEQEPVYVHESLRGLSRHAITGTGTAALYNMPSIVLRRLQAAERQMRMQADRPQPSLVDQAMVREKEDAVRRYAAALEELDGVRQGLVRALDDMVRALDLWKTQAALVATEIDDVRRTLAEAGGDADAVAAREAEHLPLRLAQARESLATLEIRLLLSTASRAAYRLELLDGLERSLKQELREAEEVRARYDEALLRLRTARRIDRLERDLRRLRTLQTDGVSSQVAGPVEERRAAYEALVALHELALEAVRQRRAMAVGVRAEPEAKPVPETTGAEPGDAPGGGAPAVATGPHLSPPVAMPASASWDVKFLDLARRELRDPALREAFDARLVAAHYAEASEEVRRLVRAQHEGSRGEGLRARYAVALEVARAALAGLGRDTLSMRVYRLPEMLASANDDFEAAMVGIAEQRERNRERLGALVSYQRLLSRQGTRSLLIRVDRSFRDPYFGDVMRETRDALESAGSWASFQGEEHLGSWMRAAWPKLLLALVAFGVAWLLAKLMRRAVDAGIDRIVAELPDLGASVREERERARQRRRHSDKAAAAITDDDVIRVPVEDLVAPGADGAAAGADDASPEDAERKEGGA